MGLLNPLAAPFTPSEGIPSPPPWPSLACSSLSSSFPSYTLHDLILAVITAYKQGLIDANVVPSSQSHITSSSPIVVSPSPSSPPSPLVADSESASALPHTSPSLSLPIQQEVSAASLTVTADNPTPPTISPPLDYSSLIDFLSLGKSGYPLVAPSKSRRSSSTQPTVKPCIPSSGTIIQQNRKPSQRSMKLRGETPKKTTTSPTRPLIPSPRITRPPSPAPILTHNRFDTISVVEEETSTDFCLALLQPLINQAINDAENKSVVQSALTDICDHIVSNTTVFVDTPSIRPNITNKKQNKKKDKKVTTTSSSSPIIDASSSLPTVPSVVDINLASVSTIIDSNINEVEKLSTIEEKVEEKVEVEMKENPIITVVQPLSSSQAKKLKKKNKMIKKEVTANRTRNITRAARRKKKCEKELEGLTQEEIGEKLREVLRQCELDGEYDKYEDEYEREVNDYYRSLAGYP